MDERAWPELNDEVLETWDANAAFWDARGRLTIQGSGSTCS